MDMRNARGLIAEKGTRVEALLRSAGGEGKGIKELSASIERDLAPATIRQIRHVYIVRNKALHEEAFVINEAELQRFVAAADDVIASLQRMRQPSIEAQPVSAPSYGSLGLQTGASHPAVSEKVSPSSEESRATPVSAELVASTGGQQEKAQVSNKPALLTKEQRERLADSRAAAEKPAVTVQPKVGKAPSKLKEDLKAYGIVGAVAFAAAIIKEIVS
ncbi:hypothetical protein [Pseudomonas citronellolis]|uniref:hypothetical protein n=1 Tax=Pseudomonas citronellolis TaxID=53408 RepID=UPI0021BEA119|nr:hypothetical protein [Pseudomonas citronellolis]UXJ53988.1 hypothetical protein N5P21_07200 [Pseudomonas citronellolis]